MELSKYLTSPPQPPGANLHPRCEQDGYGGPSKVHTDKIAAREMHCEYGKSLSLVLYFAWVWYYRTASYLLRLNDHFRLPVPRIPLLSINKRTLTALRCNSAATGRVSLANPRHVWK